MDSGLSFALAGEEQRGSSLFQTNASIFADNLQRELGNITVAGEGEVADKIKTSEARYLQLARSFWENTDPASRRTLYFSQLLPLFTEIKNNSQEIIRLNQENMVDADRQARALSRASSRNLVILLLLGMGCAVFLAYALQRAILKPIQTLTGSAKELGEGNLDQVVPIQSKDEIGSLAAAFNKLASKLRAYRQITTDQILQARQMTEITLSAFPDPVLAVSLAGETTFMNPAAEKLLNSLNIKNGLPLAVQEEVEQVLKGGPDSVPISFENAVPVRLDDHEAFLLPRVIGMRDDAGNLFGAAVVLQDVTRFRLLDEVKTNLVSTVSHELKTPLTSVRMGLFLLLEEKIGSLNSKQLELVLAARDDAERLLRMINDLLDLARLEAEKVPQQMMIVSPKSLIERSAVDLNEVVTAKDARLTTAIAPDLPNVAVDPRQIGHVFSNLLSNAAKHSKAGQEVVLSAKSNGKVVRFTVADHGPGIPQQFQNRIFERFFRIPGTESSEGIGLGLAIAREIVVAHGGSIGLHSDPAKGTEFYFDLPPAHNGAKK
ncbi:MAG: HAMP domain-containing protein [Verrucomicrobia bacterium]|nr:HAMP domain-containing protein [Verrucomicrobiota bacterium]